LAKKVLAEKTSIDLSDYSAGVYLIKFLDSENRERMSQKVIKE